MKRKKLKAVIAKLFRPLPHKMERRMQKGYESSASVNLDEAKLNCDGAALLEYEKWLLKQPDKSNAETCTTPTSPP